MVHGRPALEQAEAVGRVAPLLQAGNQVARRLALEGLAELVEMLPRAGGESEGIIARRPRGIPKISPRLRIADISTLNCRSERGVTCYLADRKRGIGRTLFRKLPRPTDSMQT